MEDEGMDGGFGQAEAFQTRRRRFLKILERIAPALTSYG
jgi:hypothetical protein